MTFLRTRDFLAVIVAVVLTRMAWRDSLESTLDASILLSFYVPSHGDEKGRGMIHIEPAVLDVDGDGTAEALAVAATDGENAWRIKILDLKAGFVPPHLASSLAPFRPKVLLESQPVTKESLMEKFPELGITSMPDPLVVTTGHVMMNDDGESSKSAAAATPLQHHEQSEINERTKKYFCGTDWHDAAERCGHPCPGGKQEECPDGEKCFADTPCDYYEHQEKHRRKKHAAGYATGRTLSTTPAGSVPSVVTFYESGILTLHSITADKEDEADGDSGNSTTTTAKKSSRRGKKGHEELELRLMWARKPLNNHTLNGWDTHKLEFVDAVSAGNQHGMIVITAIAMVKFDEDYEGEPDEEDLIRVPCVIALDAKTGETMWETISEHPELQPDEFEEEMLKPLYQGTSSLARRRSYKPSSTQSRIALNSGKTSVQEKRAGMLEANCMHSFRRSMLVSGALPFLHWSDYDISSRALHFEHQPLAHDPHHKLHKKKRKHHKGKALTKLHHDPHHMLQDEHPKMHQGHQVGGGGGALSPDRKLAPHQHHQHQRPHDHAGNHKGKSITGLAKHLSTSWLPGGGRGHHHKGKNDKHGAGVSNKHRALNEPHHGRPNVVVTHYEDRLEVRSLKNGRSLCHLTLWQETLYADLNHDGILDGLNVITGEQVLEDDDEIDAGRRWVSKLVKRVQGIENKDEKKEVDEELKGQKIDEFANLCHVQVLSGVPSKEELYSVDICGAKRDQGQSSLTLDVDAAPPMAVEPLRGKGNDVVVALNTGVVTRLEGATGNKQWQFAGVRHLADFPTWEDNSIVTLVRIDSPNVIHSMRPILLAGENSMAILSARQGKLLASATYPQPANGHPLILDFNGDGTSDILIWTPDAYWGYQVHIRTGGSFMFRMIVGLVLMGLMLALLRNRFGPQPGKRSTDA